MHDSGSEPAITQPWEDLAEAYATSRQVSADKLIEWPAQVRIAGDYHGKRVLDIGCGTGEKARYFAEHGAASVIGIDSSHGFARQWNLPASSANLQLLHGNFEELGSMPALQGESFDLIVSFQALMYARDLPQTLKTIAGLLSPGGALVFSVPHPFRFAVLKSEREGWGHGFAYHQTQPYRYPSPWKPDVCLEHATPRICDYLHAILSAGLRLNDCEEPAVTEELRRLSPEKAAWMDRYIGIILFRAQKED